MSNTNHADNELCILDLVEYAIHTAAEPVFVVSGQLG
jgi:hypothetical protein